MPAKILEFVKRSNGYRLLVHLDEERTLPDEHGVEQPDPAFLHEWTFPNLHPEIHTQGGAPLTERQFVENLMEELPRMVEVELQQRGHRERAVLSRFAEHEGRRIGGGRQPGLRPH